MTHTFADLEQAFRDVRATQEQIDRALDRIKDLAWLGEDTSLAEAMLGVLVATLRERVIYRDTIVLEIKCRMMGVQSRKRRASYA